MRHPQRPAPLARTLTRARRWRALVAGGAALAATMVMLSSGYAVAATSTVTISLASTKVGQSGAVTVSGSKSADAELRVELRPPGNTWIDVTASCAGVGVGSTTWSCALAPSGERPLGNHKIEASQVIDGATAGAVTDFVVVPPPALAAPVATPKPPAPTPTPSATPRTTTTLPTPSPEPPAEQGPELSAAPTPPEVVSLAPAIAIQPAGLELPTESVAETAGVLRGFAPPELVDRSDPAAPSVLSQGLPNVWRDPIRLLMALGMGALFLLLVAIPAEVLNSTLEANSHRWRWLYAWALPLVAGVSKFASTLPAWGSSAPVMIVLTSIAFGFADPNFGFDLTSLRLVASLAVGLLLVVYVPSMITAALLGRRWQVPTAIITQPGAIIIAVLGVIASRMLEFSPGLLVGLVLGIELAASARAEDQRRAIVTRMLVTLGISLAAWLSYSVISGALSGSDETFLSIFVVETLVATVHEGITGLLVALLPLAFLDGKTLFDQSKLIWVALAGPTAVAFALLVLPTSDRLDADAPVFLWLGVFIGFCLIVAAIWAAFRVLEVREQRALDREVEKDYAA